MSFSFGSDPEFMLVGSDYHLRSAIGVLPKKINAKSFSGSSIYYDNVLAEIAIKPSLTKDEFLNNTRKSINKLAQLVQPLRIEICAAESYPVKELKHEESRMAGCNPEWNVYTLQCVLPPEDVISKTSFRTAGGHIHVGSKYLQDSSGIFNFIRMMDLFVCIPSLFMDIDPTSKERRTIYGHAGSHRVTDYGVEYRALGNFWFSSPEYASLIYDLTLFVHSFVVDNEQEKFWSVDESLLDSEDPSKAYSCFGYNVKLLERCINTCDLKAANKFMTFISHYMPEHLFSLIQEKTMVKKLPDPYVSWDITK